MVTIVMKSIKAQRIVLGKMSSDGTSGNKMRKALGSCSQRSSWDFGVTLAYASELILFVTIDLSYQSTPTFETPCL